MRKEEIIIVVFRCFFQKIIIRFSRRKRIHYVERCEHIHLRIPVDRLYNSTAKEKNSRSARIARDFFDSQNSFYTPGKRIYVDALNAATAAEKVREIRR